MKKILFISVLILALANTGWSMDKEGHGGHGEKSSHTMKEHSMDHGSMDHGMDDMGTSTYNVTVDEIQIEFQVMSLAAMNMKDPEGRTHHIMSSFTKGDTVISKAAGKIKVIAPSGKEQTATLQDFGSGVFAANFSFDEKGKWGVICLFKDESGKHVVKFWHHQK